MRKTGGYITLSAGVLFLATGLMACSSAQEQTRTAVQTAKQEPAAATQKPGKKAVDVEGVISSVGQRTITFQMERKGKVREEVVGVDDKTNIEKAGNKVKLADLQEADKALINYEPEAYTPALAIKVVGRGTVQKIGGGD